MKPTNIANPDYFHKVVDCQWACPAHTPVPEYIRLIAQGRYTEAEPLFKRSLAIYDSTLGAEDPKVAAALTNLALLYRNQGRNAEAQPLEKRSLAIRKNASDLGHPSTAGSLDNLASTLGALGRFDEARAALRTLASRGLTAIPRDLNMLLGLYAFGALLGLTIASERLAHPEENHSSGPRVLVTVLLLGFLGAVAWSSGGRLVGNADFAEPAIVGLSGLAFAHVFFQTEREDLPRRAALGVPSSRWLAFLVGPFLPGGGRALLLYALQVALTCERVLDAPASGRTDQTRFGDASPKPPPLFDLKAEAVDWSAVRRRRERNGPGSTTSGRWWRC